MVVGPAGTPLEFLVTLAMSGTIAVSACEPSFPTPLTAIGAGQAGISSQVSVNGGATGVAQSACSLLGPNTASFVALVAGTPVVMTQTLSAVVLASRGNANATADATHSSLLFFDAVTPGASIDWDSGHDYSSPQPPVPVPEPTTLSLVALGAVFLRRQTRPDAPSVCRLWDGKESATGRRRERAFGREPSRRSR
jgi:hypothetical protein